MFKNIYYAHHKINLISLKIHLRWCLFQLCVVVCRPYSVAQHIWDAKRVTNFTIIATVRASGERRERYVRRRGREKDLSKIDKK